MLLKKLTEATISGANVYFEMARQEINRQILDRSITLQRCNRSEEFSRYMASGMFLHFPAQILRLRDISQINISEK